MRPFKRGFRAKKEISLKEEGIRDLLASSLSQKQIVMHEREARKMNFSAKKKLKQTQE